MIRLQNGKKYLETRKRACLTLGRETRSGGDEVKRRNGEIKKLRNGEIKKLRN